MTKSEMREEVLQLLGILSEVEERLTILHGELQNRPRKTNGSPVSVPIDTTVVRKVQTLHMTDPGMPQHEIAKIVGINQGRVSEILAGKRT
jgi:hypothetical protein